MSISIQNTEIRTGEIAIPSIDAIHGEIQGQPEPKIIPPSIRITNKGKVAISIYVAIDWISPNPQTIGSGEQGIFQIGSQACDGQDADKIGTKRSIIFHVSRHDEQARPTNPLWSGPLDLDLSGPIDLAWDDIRIIPINPS
ncbi:MAG: hypothetical protein JWN86_1841 [Planctomycetota bacterium]|nr:hypothetical protein [Planctomycetota bacterium]